MGRRALKTRLVAATTRRKMLESRYILTLVVPGMDRETMDAVGEALDTAITKVAQRRLASLSAGQSDQRIAMRIYRSLDSLRKLQRGVMPKYNDWDALFYCLWYQPGHVNLAYTLARKVPTSKNPLVTGKGQLSVIDFGCGALAVQFGLALVAADTLAKRRKLPQIAVLPIDTSEPMKSIGWSIWSQFTDEIERYPELRALQSVCNEMKFDNEHRTEAVVWLTALHVAYEENTEEVESALADIIEREQPNVVLVTTQGSSATHAYSAEAYDYSNQSHAFFGTEFELEGRFEVATRFRSNVYDDRIDLQPTMLVPAADDFVRNYLKRHPTAWTTPRFETSDSLYIRD